MAHTQKGVDTVTADQVVKEVTKWINELAKWVKSAGALALLLIVSAMLVEAAARLFDVGINFKAPDWNQGTALTIAALAFALGKT